jgi:mono/diheme cytochrome c family protein
MKVLTVLVLVIIASSKVLGQTVVPWIAPNDANSKVNLTVSNEAILKEAKKIYQNTCAPCHGDKGKGDGIAAVACNPKPADHTSAALQKESDGSLFWKITVGRGQMISYKSTLTDDQRWKLVSYIRSLSIKK